MLRILNDMQNLRPQCRQNNAELMREKTRLIEAFHNLLGIIVYTAQYPLCRARHKGYFV